MEPICPICACESVRTETKYGPRNDCCGLWSWGGKPLVSGETHNARKHAHFVFDQIWQSGLMKRREAYAWLSRKMGIDPIHIADLSEEDALEVARLASDYLLGEDMQYW